MGASAGLFPEEAVACGGFFCSQQQPVNQAAERIIFADNHAPHRPAWAGLLLGLWGLLGAARLRRRRSGARHGWI